MTTDAGKEFLGVVKRWMYDEITLPGRHKQLANVDNLINQLNSLFNGLMNKVEKQTGKVSKAWTKYVPQIRELLNEVRRKDLDPDYDQPIPETTDKKGRLIKPKKPREIKQVLTYSGDVLYRYVIKGIKYVSYTEDELLQVHGHIR